MDNGQTKQSNQATVPQDFFTTGVGTNNPNTGSPESEAINLNTSGDNWDTRIEHDPQKMGGSALHENNPSLPDQTTGDAVSLEMPPEYVEPIVGSAGIEETPTPHLPQEPLPQSESQEPTPPQSEETTSSAQGQAQVINYDHIKTSDMLSPSSFIEIDKAKEHLDKDGKMGDYYTTVRHMMQANIDNSYGDKANWKGDK